MSSTKTVVVLGAAYGGVRAAQILAAGIPAGWRIILIDRNSHMNHLYIFPRLAVYPGHECEAFIPYTKVFLLDGPIPHICIQAHVTAIKPNCVTLSQAFPEHDIPTTNLAFDYAIYALGSHLPLPLDIWATDAFGNMAPPNAIHLPVYQGTKAEGIAWMSAYQKLIESAPTVLVVGGGALGIQFATDIAAVHPTKDVTLLHSRLRLLPRYDEAMHVEILRTLESIDNINVILGERIDLESVKEEPAKRNEKGQRLVRTTKGREIAADLILLCTGQTPNTELLRDMDPATVNSDQFAHVLPTMQLGVVSNAKGAEKEVKAPVPYVNVGGPSPDEGANTVNLETSLQQLSVTDESAAPTSTPSVQTQTQTAAATQVPPNPSGDATEPAPAPAPAPAPEPEALEETPYPNIFAIGDAADAFGAIHAGHNAYFQGEFAARNIIRLIGRSNGKDEPLERYKPGAPAIKVSLGLGKSVYQYEGKIGMSTGDPDDLSAAAIWAHLGIKVESDEDMRA